MPRHSAIDTHVLVYDGRPRRALLWTPMHSPRKMSRSSPGTSRRLTNTRVTWRRVRYCALSRVSVFASWGGCLPPGRFPGRVLVSMRLCHGSGTFCPAEPRRVTRHFPVA